MEEINDIFSNNKIFCHGHVIEEYLSKEHTSHPVTVEIDLTNRCNNKCPKCTGQTKNNNNEMDYSLFIRIIDELSKNNIRGIVLTGGGEPLLYSRLLDAMRYIKSKKIEIGLITSGQSPSDNTIFIKSLLENLTWIRFSLDAGTPIHYKLTHGLDENRFNYVNSFIYKILEIKSKYKYNVDIGVGYLVSLLNPEKEQIDIHQCVLNIAHKSLDYIQLRPYHDNKYDIDFLDETKEYINRNYPNTLLYNTEMSRDESREYLKCHGSRFSTTICVDGKVYYCCLSRNMNERCLGDLVKQPFKEIWTKENLERVDKCINVNWCLPRCKNNVINNRLEYVIKMYNNKHKDFL